MNPLLFADWAHINRVFCLLMWTLAFVLLMSILAHGAPTVHPAHAHPVVVGR